MSRTSLLPFWSSTLICFTQRHFLFSKSFLDKTLILVFIILAHNTAFAHAILTKNISTPPKESVENTVSFPKEKSTEKKITEKKSDKNLKEHSLDDVNNKHLPIFKKYIFPIKALPLLPSSVEKKRADPLDTAPGKLTRLRVYVDRPVAGEQKQLEQYLKPLLNIVASGALAQEAETRLMGIGRYRAAVCRYTARSENKKSKTLVCGVTRFITIRSLELEGVPWTFLEENIRRRIFLRPGEILEKREESGESRIHRQEDRIQRFLKRKGFRGARVLIQIPALTTSSDVKVKVRIIGGEFTRVRTVNVHNVSPFQVNAFREAFSAMCTGDGLLEGFETQSIHCFSDDRLREVIAKLEKELVRLGYPEGRIRVKKNWVPTQKTSDPNCNISPARAHLYKKEKPKICVDLDVTVNAGPHLIQTLSFHDEVFAKAKNPPKPTRPPFFFSPAFSGLSSGFLSATRGFTETLSRSAQTLTRRPLREASDTHIVPQELLDVLTFNSTRSAQENEVQQSKLALQKELARRGYLRAKITPSYLRQGQRVEVHFAIQLGPPMAIESISFIGNKSFSDDELRGIGLSAQPRRGTHSGFTSPQALELDRQRLVYFYEQEGFSEVEVNLEAAQQGDKLHVVFRIQEESRWKIARIDLEGVPLDLVEAILSSMEHCLRGEAGKKKWPLLTPESCRGAPFLPGDANPLDTDSRRALNVLVANGYPFAKTQLELQDFLDDSQVSLKLIVDLEGARKQKRIDFKAPNSSSKNPSESPISNQLETGRVARGTLFIDGNTRTREDVIRREFGVNSKELRPREIAEGVSRLRKTGLFNRVNLSYIGIQEERDTVDLRIRVEEKPVITGDVSASFSTAQNFGLHTELRDRNLLGSMWDLSAKGDFGLFIGRFSRLELPFRWPRLLGFPIDLKVNPSVLYQDLPASIARLPPNSGPVSALALWEDGSKRRRQLRVDLNAALDFKLLPQSNKLVLTVAYDARIDWDDPLGQRLDLFSAKSFTSLDGIGTLLFESNVTPVPFLGGTLTLAYRDVDNLFDPKEGVVLETSLTGGHPLPILASDGSFGVGEWVLLPSFKSAGYLTFSRVTFAGSLKGWWGISHSDNLTFPSILIRNQTLLASGGDRSVRGFQQDEIGVKDLAAIASAGTPIYDDSTHLLDVMGVIANFEIRFLFLKNFLLGDVNLAAFIDTSLITDNPSDLLKDPATLLDEEGLKRRYASPRFGIGIGLGLRYVLPVGPMSIDFAISPSKLYHEAITGNLGPEDLLPRPHIQLGYAF